MWTYTAKEKGFFVLNQYGKNICKVNTDFIDQEEKARLIAAAPELLEACKEAENYLRYNHGQGLAAYELCKNAIAKAEGK